MFVESDRHIQADKTSNGQGEMRGSQDGSNISAQKFNAEVEQNIKTNDLILPSQRPVVGEGSPHPNTELGDIRANATKTDVLNQIVDRAVFKLNNEQSEVRIDLKPDFLGHVRLQIVTDSHQVNLRILAESSIVKELIDGNLNQLKNDLQAQGLKVEEIEVAVAKDFNVYSRNQDSTARGGPGKRGFSLKDQEGEDGELPENNIEPTQLSTQPGGVNCFA
jgi:flagellar hook-length control protein FliK